MAVLAKAARPLTHLNDLEGTMEEERVCVCDCICMHAARHRMEGDGSRSLFFHITDYSFHVHFEAGGHVWQRMKRHV